MENKQKVINDLNELLSILDKTLQMECLSQNIKGTLEEGYEYFTRRIIPNIKNSRDSEFNLDEYKPMFVESHFVSMGDINGGSAINIGSGSATIIRNRTGKKPVINMLK